MSRIPRQPKYLRQREHGRSDRAFTIVDGKRIKLGVYGSPESFQRFAELTTGKTAAEPVPTTPPTAPTLSVLMASYLEFAIEKYGGSKTSEVVHLKSALRILRRTHGQALAKDFGPKAYQQMRRAMIDADWSRRYIRDQTRRIKRMIGWAVLEELVPGDAKHRLDAVPGLTTREFGVRETDPVKPVSQADIDATLAELGPEVADMVRLLLLTGMRPGELVQLDAAHIDRCGDVWQYTPPTHKTAGKGKRRVVAIGPKAQEVLGTYLFRSPCFKHKVASIRQAVQRTARRAGVERWFPYQLRHSAGTNARAVAGLEGAQAILGHTRPDVTLIYAKSNDQRAAEVARAIG